MRIISRSFTDPSRISLAFLWLLLTVSRYHLNSRPRLHSIQHSAVRGLYLQHSINSSFLARRLNASCPILFLYWLEDMPSHFTRLSLDSCPLLRLGARMFVAYLPCYTLHVCPQSYARSDCLHSSAFIVQALQ
ncbi:hypothetical protein GALMADRAFT_1083421 [Galerina marginata CBS 339.88]|uniref:Uncharacterized protein n=1 Tax=Galerina marginata (strain CBS 339.88) TaxID=685588 RepID=A0A067S8Z2_GALM3|nr:hypothetical protein GALMADRAFT_1083421 [Galerina marginata CBS 339.88]